MTPVRQLPTSLGVGYVNDPSAWMTLQMSLEVDAATLGLSNGGSAQADVDVAAAVVNFMGKNVMGFEQALSVKPHATAGAVGRRPRPTPLRRGSLA